MANIADDPDDLGNPVLSPGHRECLAQWGLSWPELFRQRLVDDDFRARFGGIGRVEVASRQQRDSQRLQQLGVDPADVGNRGIVIRGTGPIIDPETGGRSVSAERNKRPGASRGDSG